MTIPTQKHILFHCVPAWGHFKPFFPLAVQILRSRPNIVISIFCCADIYSKSLDELDKLPSGDREDIKARLHVIDISGVIINPLMPILEFEPVFKAMYRGEPIKCLATGKEYTLAPPTVAIIDPFAGYAIEAIHETTENKLPILIWASFTAGEALIEFSEPRAPRLDVRLIRYGTEEELMPMMHQFVKEITERVVSAPGVPALYEYELYPQEIPLVGNIFLEIAPRYMTTCNGMIIASSSAYDGEALHALEKRYGTMGQVVYPVGPLSLPEPPSKKKGKQEVVKFLDKMQSRCGERSVIYMSLGTFFWPSNPEKVWAVMEEILASGTPLVWAHPSPLCQVPEDIQKMFQNSEIALETQWAPQEAILSHSATGWFISHGGWNSTQEAMLYRVPQIFYPQGVDQPQNAAKVQFIHKSGFELIEVRTGEYGTRVPYRFKDADRKDLPTFTVEAVRREIRDILKKLKGEEGSMVRKNFEKMSKEFYGGWDEGGEARESLNAFLKKFVDF
ncbi:UDP-Glycosyltransferase/glycogen phosphorylase [Dendrothele bispora CBS 962.96]|uniref:UDP-Glycosyltransferase/glycogen phosphorylase n=1 Tax=Dendrothele bispora (strain CBS 962.96) TaxID=1314807 RepID=A0A4S8L6T4_DENBC|nr:UDP-Glycosyltransferase/glycogen phosphorylase [Dendrothele bispora CBS 962.96]